MIRYEFTFDDGAHGEIAVDETRAAADAPATDVPEWARIDHHRCDDCPVPGGPWVACPAAVSLASVLRLFGGRTSHDPVDVVVHMDPARVVARVSCQEAARSVLGLLLPVSGCPALAPLRPMARFHVPFGGSEHTVFRFASTWLVAQYLRQGEGKPADWAMGGLDAMLERLHHVNARLADRARAASRHDAAVNSVVVLDTLAQRIQLDMFDRLADLAPLFAAYVED